MAKCAIYTRVSSAEQTKGKSLDVQKKMGISYCKQQKLDYEIFDEGGASSRHETIENRPCMQRLLDKIAEARFRYLYVIDFDRLSRNEIVTAIIKQKLRVNDVKLIVVILSTISKMKTGTCLLLYWPDSLIQKIGNELRKASNPDALWLSKDIFLGFGLHSVIEL